MYKIQFVDRDASRPAVRTAYVYADDVLEAIEIFKGYLGRNVESMQVRSIALCHLEILNSPTDKVVQARAW